MVNIWHLVLKQPKCKLRSSNSPSEKKPALYKTEVAGLLEDLKTLPFN